MTLPPPPARPPIPGRLTAVPPKPRTIRVRRQEPSNDNRPQTLRRTAATASLAHGNLHSVHVVHRCRHGLDRRPEVPDIGSDSQASGDCDPGAGTHPSGAAYLLWRSVVANRPAGTDEAGCLFVASHPLRTD